MKPTITFIGLGTMGSHMVRNLAARGYPLTLVDVNEDVVRTMVAELGATPAKAPADGAGSQIVILMLPSSTIVGEVLDGTRDGTAALSTSMAEGTLVIDMGSSDPISTRAVAERLRARGVRIVDAPVSGGPRRAATGELTIMVGGDAADVEEATPVLEALGTTIVPTGAVGSAHAMKALNNLLSAVGLVGALEVLAAGVKFGLDPRVMLEVLNASTGRNQSTEVKIAQQVLSGDLNVGFSLELMFKDISTALALAESEGIDIRVGAATVEVCRDALGMLGDHRADQAELALYVGSRSGVELVPSSAMGDVE